jgi:hypothetical protein
MKNPRPAARRYPLKALEVRGILVIRGEGKGKMRTVTHDAEIMRPIRRKVKYHVVGLSGGL